MKASDIMVSNVITVGPDALVQDVADLLLRHRISAVPVVGVNGEILGIVSEGDLMNRPESETVHRKSWWLDALASSEGLGRRIRQVAFAIGHRRHDPRGHHGFAGYLGGRGGRAAREARSSGFRSSRTGRSSESSAGPTCCRGSPA